MKLIKKAISGVILNALALYILMEVLPEIQYSGGFLFFLVGGLVIGFMNYFLKPLMKIISLPLIFITAGLFFIVINAALLGFFSYFLEVIQFRDLALTFPNYGSYVIGALVFGFINWIEHLFFKN